MIPRLPLLPVAAVVAVAVGVFAVPWGPVYLVGLVLGMAIGYAWRDELVR